MTRLTLRPKGMSDILEKVAEEIYKYKGYPGDSDFSKVAEALIREHPYLVHTMAATGESNGSRPKWVTTELKCSGCAQFLPNSLQSKALEDELPAKK